ncbi:MAG: cobalamin-dependent protein [Bacteroidales bacterium]|nr:cobalamin-dependent protein [Bacteroidales bacterium]MBN2750725.1 cobalamin-dependent protein [Bacteroidales bacterium]
MDILRNSVVTILQQEQTKLAEKIVTEKYKREPHLWDKYGEAGKIHSLRDVGYHLQFLAEAVSSGNILIFSDYVAWVKKLFKGLNLPEASMQIALECIDTTLKQELSTEQYPIISPFIAAGLTTLNEPLPSNSSFIDRNAPLGELAHTYTQTLLNGDRHTAQRLILDAVEQGVPIRDIYLNVFQKSQYEIGNLWLENKINVAKEHFCTAATQHIMSQLYPHIFSTQRKGVSFLAANIGGELHEIGIRMVADFFEMEGWDTYYLGSNTPVDSIVKSANEYKVNLIGLSITLPTHISLLKNAVAIIRKGVSSSTKIMIGGLALNREDISLSEFQADGYAPNALLAVAMGNQLIKS